MVRRRSHPGRPTRVTGADADRAADDDGPAGGVGEDGVGLAGCGVGEGLEGVDGDGCVGEAEVFECGVGEEGAEGGDGLVLDAEDGGAGEECGEFLVAEGEPVLPGGGEDDDEVAAAFDPLAEGADLLDAEFGG
ncbi:MAG: hypothetical protein HND58_13225 [Planctomycetota bacterium]|nr:MAG: hypothetical protein HND58_13225 [Planctomycetota bacterium]